MKGAKEGKERREAKERMRKEAAAEEESRIALKEFRSSLCVDVPLVADPRPKQESADIGFHAVSVQGWHDHHFNQFLDKLLKLVPKTNFI